MTKREQKLWDEAYKSSHVAADICEAVQDRNLDVGEYRLQWLLEETKNLLAAARALRRAGCRRKCSKPTNKKRKEQNEKW